MAVQDFGRLVAGGLLRDVERIVIDAYCEVHPEASMPDAYRWLRYEDPEPVDRLREGAGKLRVMGARFDAGAVDKACAKAAKMGYLN
jgi:hypothetical protein